MARIRTIKPEFWTDEKLSECSLSARLLFVGLISHADDEGRLDYSPTRTRLQLFPCGKVSHKQLIDWFIELNDHALIRAYTVDSKHYLDIPGFTKHQRINRPTPSRLPIFSIGTSVKFIEDSLSTHGALTSGMEGKGMEGKGSLRKSPLPPFDPTSIRGLNVSAWNEWIAYRADRKPAIKPKSYPKAAAEMAKLGTDQQAAVDYSIANTYQGLIEPKTKGNGNGRHAPNDDAAWAEAKAAAAEIGFRAPLPGETPTSYMRQVKFQRDSPPRRGSLDVSKLTSQLRMAK